MNIDITEKEQKLVIERFQELKTERNRYVSRWKDIQNYVAITNEVNSEFDETRQPNEQKDVFINDPTGFVSVNQAGDYLAGILWNANAVTLEPSEYIKNNTVGTDLSEFYQKATKIFLAQMNSTDAGFSTVLKSCAYDQYSYGTSGIGTFLSREYQNGQSECCLSFKSFGVWNSCCDEGANNKIDVVYTVYHWRLNQIIEEFCCQNGELSKELISNMPEEIQGAINANKFNKKFKIVYGILPNNSFSLGKRGKNGARFKGYWFIENSEKKIFKVDYFNKMPISMCRAIRAGSQIYGESAGTLAISSIKMLNYIKGTTVDNIEKTTDQALGVISGALVAGKERALSLVKKYRISTKKDLLKKLKISRQKFYENKLNSDPQIESVMLINKAILLKEKKEKNNAKKHSKKHKKKNEFCDTEMRSEKEVLDKKKELENMLLKNLSVDAKKKVQTLLNFIAWLLKE